MWNVFVENPKARNLELIFPTQQKDVEKIAQFAIENDNVKKVIIFGSSVTAACNPWSDIDVYFELSQMDYSRPRGLEAEADVWTNFTADDSLLCEIEETGVIVYEA